MNTWLWAALGFCLLVIVLRTVFVHKVDKLTWTQSITSSIAGVFMIVLAFIAIAEFGDYELNAQTNMVGLTNGN